MEEKLVCNGEMSFVSPKYVVACSDEKKTKWGMKQVQRENIQCQTATHLLTFTVEGYMDIFTHPDYRKIILESFAFCREHKKLKIHGYVIMSNHIHCIWKASNENLSDIVRDFKTFTSKRITEMILQESDRRKEWLSHMLRFYAKGTNANKYTKFWQNGNKPLPIYASEEFEHHLLHIHNNPVRAGIVLQANHYINSSASNYTQLKSIAEIDIVDSSFFSV